ncbi:MAG: DUF5011 domain-containing protein [Nanoarchaeota archaeon]
MVFDMVRYSFAVLSCVVLTIVFVLFGGLVSGHALPDDTSGSLSGRSGIEGASRSDDVDSDDRISSRDTVRDSRSEDVVSDDDRSLSRSGESEDVVSSRDDDIDDSRSEDVDSEWSVSDKADTQKPILIMNGPTPQKLEIGDNYTEYGAFAEDDKDGVLTDDVVIDSSDVDTSAAGNYTVSYSVEDSSGNRNARNRTVMVLEPSPPGIRVISPFAGSGVETYHGVVKFVVETDEPARVNYSLDSKTNVSLSDPFPDSGDGISLSDPYKELFHSDMLAVSKGDLSSGLHNVTFYAVDDRGHMNTTTVVFNITDDDEDIPLNMSDEREMIDLFQRPDFAVSNEYDYYGSGDLDGDGDIDFSDHAILYSDILNDNLNNNVPVPNPDYECRNDSDTPATDCANICDGNASYCLVLEQPRNKTLERADVNGDGVIDSQDDALLFDYLHNNINHLPSHWYLLNRTEKIEWIENVASLTRADDYLAKRTYEGFSPYPPCGTWAYQTEINLRGYTQVSSLGNLSLDYNGRFNLPVQHVSTMSTSGAHGINGVYVGPKSGKPKDAVVTNFSNWYFFEPQEDHGRVKPGENWSMASSGYVTFDYESPNFSSYYGMKWDLNNGSANLSSWESSRYIRRPLRFDTEAPEINLSTDLDGKHFGKDMEMSLDYTIQDGEYLYDDGSFSVFNGSFLDRCYYTINGKKENIDCYWITSKPWSNTSYIGYYLYNDSGTIRFNQTEGKNTLSVYARDVAGNYRKKTMEWVLDTENDHARLIDVSTEIASADSD